jgi:regulator of replication initiation timing
LDNVRILQQFEEIEAKVEGLIRICRSLEVTNAELRNKIGNLESDIQAKIEAEQRYQEEKALIRNKVDGLLHRLGDAAEKG